MPGWPQAFDPRPPVHLGKHGYTDCEGVPNGRGDCGNVLETHFGFCRSSALGRQ